MSFGTLFAQAQVQLRGAMEPGAFGWPVVNGAAVETYDCTSKNLSLSSRGELLLTGSANADSTDQRSITLNPIDFTKGGILTPPGEGQPCLYQGALFIVKKISVPEIAFGVAIALPLEIFRAPSSSDTPAALTQNAKWPAPPQ